MINIIILAALAFFIGYKLYKTLGNTNYDNELSSENKKKYEDFKEFILKDGEQPTENITITPSKIEEKLSNLDKEVLKEIKSYNPSFTIENFIKGAKLAFENIIKAYAEEKTSVLKQLSKGKALENFLQDINYFKSNSQKKNISLVGIQDIMILSVTKNGNEALIKVNFESEQIANVTDNISGNLISGSLTKITKRNDEFTFVKDITSKSNMWMLIDNEK